MTCNIAGSVPKIPKIEFGTNIVKPDNLTLPKETCLSKVVQPPNIPIDINLDEVGKLYDMFSEKIRAQLQDDYDCKKINGTTFADLWAKMLPGIMQTSVTAVLQLQAKETPHDRALKEAQLCEMKRESVRKDMLSNEEGELKNVQAKEISRESIRRDELSEKEAELKGAQAQETIRNSARQDISTLADCELRDTQSKEIKKESCRKDALTEVEHKTKTAQADKIAYEKDVILPISASLTKRQIAGFDDNINIKVMESKWSYNAMITASGIGTGSYIAVDQIPTGASCDIGTSSGAKDTLNLDAKCNICWS